jgi:SAM-dependent methyltransferase
MTEDVPTEITGRPRGFGIKEYRWLQQLLDWDEAWYLARYPDIREAYLRGELAGPFIHYLVFGHGEGRFASAAVEEAARHGDTPRRDVLIKLGEYSVPLSWPIRGEPAKSFLSKLANGFYATYLSGRVILDIGYKGAEGEDAVQILPHAIGVDLDYPGYDGTHLPFADGSVDTVFASHVLEHIPDSRTAIREWYRTLRLGGFIVCAVPHQALYEKKRQPPSRWNEDHRRFYTPASLLSEFEESLPTNGYRVRHLADNDLGYIYDIGPQKHATGCYEIELVIEKLRQPAWEPS